MKPKRIILIRHGESEANINRAIHSLKPDYTAELTSKGQTQADEAGSHLRQLLGNESLFFYVSPYWRTRSTFEGILKHFDSEKVLWREEPRLREQEWGHIRSMDDFEKVEQERDAFGTFYFRLFRW